MTVRKAQYKGNGRVEAEFSAKVNYKNVKVTVKDTVSGYTETFNVTVVLDTVAVPDKAVKTLIDVSKSQPSLDKNPKSGVSTTPVNDNKTVVSYKETVNGTDIVISYNVDNDGRFSDRRNGNWVLLRPGT